MKDTPMVKLKDKV